MHGSRGYRRAARLPLAPIAALCVGGAAAFFFGAMPGEMLGRLLAATGIGADVPFWIARVALMAVAALAAGGTTAAVFLLLDRLDQRAGRAASNGAPVPRRADAHVDAPPRRPIFADTELGAPLDLADPLPAVDAMPEPAPDPVMPHEAERAEEEGPDRALPDSIASLMARLEAGVARHFPEADAQAPSEELAHRVAAISGR